MVVTSENILTLISVLSVLIGAVGYIGKRQSDVRLKDAEARMTDAETRATAAKTELTKAQGEAAQQTGLIETLRELVRVNEANAEAGREIVKAIKEVSTQASENYRELRKQMDANTSFINSNVVSLGERVGGMGTDLLTAIQRLPKLLDQSNYDKLSAMIGRLEALATKASPGTLSATQILPEVVAQEAKADGDGIAAGTDRTAKPTE